MRVLQGWKQAAIAGLLACAATGASAAPDLTGVWSNITRTPATGTNNPGFPLPALLPGPQAKVDAFRALVAPLGETPGGVCLGAGMPWALMGSGGYPMEFIQRPEQLTIIYELHGETRRVYFGDRNAPPEDRLPGRNGYSSGRWDGDTLVIETDNLVEQIDERIPHSADAKIVERYHVEKGADGRRVLTVDLTVTDPAFYTAPVKTTRQWAEVPNGRLLPYECAEEIWHKRLEDLAAKR